MRDGIKALLSVIPTVAAVGEAENGEDAMAMIEHCSPDPPLVDMNLSDMNDLKLTRQICDKYPALGAHTQHV